MTTNEKITRLHKSFIRQSNKILFGGMACSLMMYCLGLFAGIATASLFILLGYLNLKNHSKKLKKLFNEQNK